MNVQAQETSSNGHAGEPQPLGESQPPEESLAEAQVTKKQLAEGQEGGFYDYLREIRAELEDLQSILNNIRRGKTVIPTYKAYVTETKKNLGELMDKIKVNKSDKQPIEISSNIVAIRHLNNYWEQIQASPLIAEPGSQPELSAQLHYLDLLDEQIHAFIYQIGVLTIPHQIKQWLKITGPGYFIAFHEVFVDDLPRPEDRDRLLKMIAQTPRLTPGGFVDVDTGRIYCYSTNPWRRLLSLGMLLLGLGVATGIVVGACTLLEGVEGWPLTKGDLTRMLVAWAAILIGMGVHVVVGSAKRSKTKNGMPSVLLDLILIIDARFGEILMKLILGLIGLFGLVIISSSKLPGLEIITSFLGQAPAADTITASAQNALLAQVTPLNAFLVGYSLDSIIELFGTSMEGASQVKSLVRKSG